MEAQITNQPPRKDPTLAAVLSFFVTGMGSVYAGQTQKGIGFFVAAIVIGIIAAATTPVLFLANIVLTIVSISIAYDDAVSANTPSASEVEEQVRTQTTDGFVAQIGRLGLLHDAGVLTDDELTSQKTDLIRGLPVMNSDQATLFLLKVAEPYKEGALTAEDLSLVKRVIKGDIS